MTNLLAPVCGICGHPKRGIKPPKKLVVWVCDNCDLTAKSAIVDAED